jgi:hypothetical protein
VHPNIILKWKKEFLENATTVFVHYQPNITEKAQQRKIEQLEAQIRKKDNVIAEITKENMMLKKTFDERS